MDRCIYILCIVVFIISSGCDTQVDEPVSEFSINIGQYTDEFQNDRDANIPGIGQIILPEDLAIDLNDFPHKRIKISSTEGYSSGREYDERLSPDLTRSIYLLFAVEGSLPRLSDVVHTIPQPLGKRANADSINLDVYAFVVERPGVNYPEMIPIDFTVDDIPYTLEVSSVKHIIPLENQVIEQGTSLGELPEKEGIVIDIESEIFDRSLIPAVLVHRTEVHLSRERTSLSNWALAGMAFDSTAIVQRHKYLRAGMIQHKILGETEVRAILLRR